jgi:hypothetical protein
MHQLWKWEHCIALDDRTLVFKKYLISLKMEEKSHKI